MIELPIRNGDIILSVVCSRYAKWKWLVSGRDEPVPVYCIDYVWLDGRVMTFPRI